MRLINTLLITAMLTLQRTITRTVASVVQFTYHHVNIAKALVTNVIKQAIQRNHLIIRCCRKDFLKTMRKAMFDKRKKRHL